MLIETLRLDLPPKFRPPHRASVFWLACNYGTTNNNGNVQSINYNGGGLSYLQTFGYDPLNRLATSLENGGASWSQTNGYDRYGNRWIDLGGGNQNLYFSTSTNRITTSGYSYDAAGNLTNDTTHTYTFDAENKILKVDNVTAYTYDGEGQRVRKLVGENTRFIYGIGGQLVAEFDGLTGSLKKEYVYGASGLLATIAPNGQGSPGTQYTTSDTLGTPRVVTNSAGSVVGRHDYMPFGEELLAGTGGRTTSQGYGVTDNVRQKFTSKERDNETGLDFFEARYYASTQGRFTSVDPDNAQGKADPTDPQGWNGYSYVGNNPLIRTDPDGRLIVTDDPWWQRFKNWWRYDMPLTDKELAKEVSRRREELKANLRAMDGHEYSQEEFDRMGTRQVLNLYDRYQFGIDSGVARTVPPIPGPAMSTANVPQHAQDTLKHIEQTGRAPSGQEGGRVFRNREQLLPKTDAQGRTITYREYDVHPNQQGVPRGTERIVRGSDGRAYYTNDHYHTFTKMK